MNEDKQIFPAWPSAPTLRTHGIDCAAPAPLHAGARGYWFIQSRRSALFEGPAICRGEVNYQAAGEPGQPDDGQKDNIYRCQCTWRGVHYRRIVEDEIGW
jgi:hypothetical protein